MLVMNTTTPAKATEPTLEISQALAAANGLRLVASSRGYVLTDNQRWAIDLYPFGQTFVPSRRAPRIELRPGWGLSDAVEAVLIAMAKRKSKDEI